MVVMLKYMLHCNPPCFPSPWKSIRRYENPEDRIPSLRKIKKDRCRNIMFCDLKTILLASINFERRSCFFARRFQRTIYYFSDRFHYQADGEDYISSEKHQNYNEIRNEKENMNITICLSKHFLLFLYFKQNSHI
jgi:hypothetical protein